MAAKEILMLNPRPRRRKRRAAPVARRRASTRRTRTTRTVTVRRNPRRAIIRRRGTGPVDTLMRAVPGALVAGAGAIAVEAAINAMPLPLTMKVGVGGAATRAVGAVVLGGIVAQVARRELGNQVVAGALTVAAYQLLQPMAQRFLTPAVPAVGEYVAGGLTRGAVDYGLGEYMGNTGMISRTDPGFAGSTGAYSYAR